MIFILRQFYTIVLYATIVIVVYIWGVILSYCAMEVLHYVLMLEDISQRRVCRCRPIYPPTLAYSIHTHGCCRTGRLITITSL